MSDSYSVESKLSDVLEFHSTKSFNPIFKKKSTLRIENILVH